MSKLDPNDDDLTDAARRSYKCRIPLRVPLSRQKLPQYKPKTTFNIKSHVVSPQQPRFAAKPCSRPHSGEQQNRPKSANRRKDDVMLPKSVYSITRSRPERERLLPAPKRSAVNSKRATNDIPSSKSTRPVIMVPISQKLLTKTVYTNRTITCLPDQESINRHEDLELQSTELTQDTKSDLNDTESVTSRNEKVTQLKISWQEKSVEFEKLKNELNDKQKAISVLYGSMGTTHKKMLALGQKISLPSIEQLQIMNVANLTPEQLLQLCANDHFTNTSQHNDDISTTIPISTDEIYKMSSKLVNTCDQTLMKNKEIIYELEALLSAPEKGINLKSLLKKIKEFNAENEMLSCSFEKIRNEFFKELKYIVNFIRNIVNEGMTLYLQRDRLIRDISELNSQKDDLRKQINEADHRKSNLNKNRIEELEKQLKEEKCKNNFLKERSSRLSGQVKVNADHASQLEAALEQARSNCRSLERTIQQLKDKNQELHKDFGIEFNKFSESIRVNTAHLEEIAEAREKLQAEKEDLEKRLAELSANYNESIKIMKKDMNTKVAMVIENEKKYEDEKEKRLKLVDKVESLCAQLLESELRYKEMCRLLQEKEVQIGKCMECQKEIKALKHQLDIANIEIEKYRDKFAQQNEAIKEIEYNLQESLSIEENMKCDLRNKEEYATELEKKVDLLEQQRQDSENKMRSYEEQLSSQKNHLAQLQKDFGEFQNLSELHEMISQQRAKLLEATRQNSELAEVIQKKNVELEQHIKSIADQESIIEQRDNVIKMLSDKEEEHANIIKLLKNNLQMRTQADLDFSEKNAEIDTLVSSLEMRKQQISQLEKIILTLGDQSRKASAQRREDQEKIKYLENKLCELEIFNVDNKRNIEMPIENLDSIIKILEDELITPLEPKFGHPQGAYFEEENYLNRKIVRNNVMKYNRVQQEVKNSVIYDERKPTKVVDYKNNVESFSRNVNCEVKRDNFNRQRGITNMHTQKREFPFDSEESISVTTPLKENSSQIKRNDTNPTRNLNFLAPIQLRDDKKCLKLLKIAGHKL